MSEATHTLSEADRDATLAQSVADATKEPPAEPKQETSAKEDTPEEALAKLREDLDREKALRQSGDSARQAAETEAAQLRQAVQAGQMSLRQAQIIALGRAHEAAEATLATLRDQYAAALAGGDYAKAAEAQASMAEVAAKKVGFAGAKQQLEASPEPSAPAAQRSAEDAAMAAYTPRTRDWLQRHPDLLRDPKRMQLAIAAHHEAVAGDYVPDSDAYFDMIERRLGYKQDVRAGGSDHRRPAAALRPSHNGGAPGRNDARVEVRDMTPHMLELAKQSDMKPEAWLKSYNELLAEGKIEKIN